jgi:AraC-like DNA-binding protein
MLSRKPTVLHVSRNQTMPTSTLPPLSLLPPPYGGTLPFEPAEGFPSNPEVLWGAALLWNTDAGHGTREMETVSNRPGGLPLIILLPPASRLRRLRSRILQAIEESSPHSILPHHPRHDLGELVHLLGRGPEDLGGELLDYLRWRGIILDRETRRIVHRLAELSAEVTTLTAAARGVYLSRRALGRRFRDRGLPVPSHWLQFCRLLRAASTLQASNATLFEAARKLNYPDGFTLSNQMERLLGFRPSTVRERLGWEWIVEAWLRKEQEEGGLALTLNHAGSTREVQARSGCAAASTAPSMPGRQARASNRAKRKSEARSGGAAA